MGTTQSAVTGRTGTSAYNVMAGHLARTLRWNIEREMVEVEAFTRDDLMYLRCYQHVSLISRYRYVCAAVRQLVDDGYLVERPGYTLVLAKRAKAFDKAAGGHRIGMRYAVTVNNLLMGMPTDADWDVMDVVEAWSGQDQRLTENSKRIAAREGIATALRDRTVERSDAMPNMYRRLP